MDYADRMGLGDDIVDGFVTVIRSMDNGYVEWEVAEIEKRRRTRT